MDLSSGSEFLCPRCKVPLKEVRTSGGVLYGCDRCGGRAVTIELLRKRFTSESINPLWLHAMRGEGRIGLPCPSCLQPMIGVVLSDQSEIKVDVCQHCHFIWFDAHEVDTLVPRRRSRSRPNPNFRKERVRCSRWQKSSVCRNRPKARILTAPHQKNRGNRSPRSWNAGRVR
jgi:Zn-finger nucleic acid-binding protein